MIPPLPFLEFLSGALALDQAPALCDDKSEGWVRYGDLRASVKRLAPFWLPPSEDRQKGLVLCASPRTVAGVTAYLSAAAAGHAVLMLDPATTRVDLFIDAYKPDWVVLPNATKPQGAYIPVEWPLNELFLWRKETSGLPVPHSDLFLLLCPPGPTESVKTVRLSYKAVAHNTQTSLESLAFDKQERPLLIMPLTYSFGLSVLHMTLAVGGSLVMSELVLKNHDLWQFAQKREATLFAGVPYHYEYLARAGIDNLHVPRIKTFLQAGGRMPLERTQEILKQVTARNGKLFILYGLTEASPRIASLALHERPDKIGSVGKVIRDGVIEKSGPALTYRGPNVMMGYAKGREDLGKGDEEAGHLALPDHGYVDEEGFLFFDA